MTHPAHDRSAWLHGPQTPCNLASLEQGRAYHIVLLGAPGVGKGTQAELLCGALGTCHLSTGDVFRAAKCAAGNLTPAMEAALGYMQRGELVPDDTVIDLVRERIGCLKCECGFLLDGFPRTVAQAQALDSMLREAGLTLDAVLNYDLPLEKVVERLSGRRTCRQCKSTFHVVMKPPARQGICDKCGGELYQREDDRPESVRVRLEAYERSTAPLTDYYSRAGLLVNVPSDGTPEEVFARALEMLKQRG